jgi:hypothetical protein
VRGAIAASVAIAFVALSGVGFACVQGNGGCQGGNGGSCQSNPEIAWVSPASTTVSGSWVTCHESYTSSELTLTVSGLTPGATCSLSATLENVGQEAVTLGAAISASLPSACKLYTYSDNLLSAAHPPTVNPGKVYGYSSVVKLEGSAANGCEGTTATFTVTITANGASSCNGFPQGYVYSPTEGGDCCG